MKRRCCLALAMIGDPPTIFLDEPSSGLDPVKRRQFWQLIKNLTQEKAVLLTTHLMEEADTLCDEIGIITNGRLRCVGTAIGLKKTYSEGYKL
jgi:ABC-type multidrug transport system ATPase subunit